MADTETNLDIWNSSWDWSEQGEEWSRWWGGSEAMWFGALLPRIHAFIPTGTILEIAPGYGRWTQFLKDRCEQLVLVDLAERCIEHCRERFVSAENIEYHVNDGKSLEMIADQSIDFVFSFDSLVHAESDVIESYLVQLARKLKPDGVGFVHHSNIGNYRALTALARRTPSRALPRLVSKGVLIDVGAWRAESVTADGFASLCDRAGLVCLAQEKINWEHGPYLIDALSTFTPRRSVWERPREVLRNPSFRDEAKRMARLHARTSFPNSGGEGTQSPTVSSPL